MKKTVVPFLILLLMTACPEDGGRNIDVAPRIDLIGPTEVFFNINDTYIEYGYTATDVDGNDVTSLVRRDISDLNMGKEGSYQISYTAVDRRGVKADPVYRVVNVGDAFAPEITIAGSNPLLVKLGTEFTPPSASALAYDGTDISDSIAVDASSVDTSKVGTYIVSYSVTDASGISGSASLFVYVLESSSPRIIIPEMGSSEESPFQIQNLSSDASIEAESYFYDSLPLFRAFDLEDGDISYKVRVDETSLTASGFLDALKAEPVEGTIYELFLTVSDNDGNVPVPLPSFFVAIVADAEPPVITVGTEGPYELEVDMWSNNTPAWTELLESLKVTVWDNSWGANTAAKPFTPNSIPNDDNNQPLLQELTIEYVSLQTALEWTKGGNLDIYDYNDPRSSVNIKAVTFKATDNTGNTSSLPISVRLVDTTPAEILDGNPQIAFGAYSIGTEKQLRYRDNSGQEGYCSGLTLEKISNALVQGSFNVDFTAPLLAPDKPSASAKIKTAKVTVGSPLNNPSGGTNYMQNNLLNADFDGVNAQWNGMNWDGTASGSWWKMQPTDPDKWGYVDGADRYWRWTSTWSENTQTFDSFPAYNEGNLIVGGVKFPATNSQISALLFSGTRHVAVGWPNDAWITNIRFTIALTEANRNVNLYNGVSYCFGYDAANYAAHDSTYGAPQQRSVTFSRTGGSGTFGGQTSVISTYASQDNSIYFPTANTGEKNEADMWHLLASHPSVTNKGGAKDFRSNWMIKNDNTVKVTGGNITAVNVTIQVNGSNEWENDYGGFISNIRIIPVTWPGKKTLTDPDSPQGFYKYNLSSGAVTWSETE